MKSNSYYDENIARKFHDIKYYETTEDYIQNMDLIFKDKENLKTEKKPEVSEIISSFLNYASDPNNDKTKVFRILNNIYEKNRDYAFNKDLFLTIPTNNDLLNLVADPSLLYVSYKKIRKNKGANTKAHTMSANFYNKLEPDEKSWVNKTQNGPDGFDALIFETTSKLIRENRYPWGCSRRIYIDKPGKKDAKRPLTIPPFMDRVVQEAITTVLMVIYEPYFEKRNRSFGFRPNKGVHDAINYLTSGNCIGMTKALEGDIKSAYDKVDRNILIEILGEKIQDRKFLNFIEKRLNYTYFDTKINKYVTDKEGVPQGGIDAPYLWNIYMSKFDDFIIEHLNNKFYLLNNFTKDNKSKKTGSISLQSRQTLQKKKRTVSSIIRWIKNNYNKEDANDTFQYMIKLTAVQLRQYLDIYDITSVKEIMKTINYTSDLDILNVKNKLILLENKLQKQIFNLPSRDENRLDLRFAYARYADDWILLTNCNLSIMQQIKSEISDYLHNKLKATLSDEKTLITNLRNDSARFLGFEIKTYKNFKTSSYFKTDKKGNKVKVKAVTAGYRVFANPDKQRLIDRFHSKGYCNQNGFPREVGFLTNLEDFTIIDRYNAVIAGITNYYAEFVKNPKRDLSRWIYILRYSCYKTLAHKHKTSIREIIKKYRTIRDINSKPSEVTIAVTVQNIINDVTYEKSWTLLNLESALKNAFALQMKSRINDNFYNLENGKPCTYISSIKSRITNDNFLDKINWINIRTQSSFELPCSICGSTEDIQMHHINHVRKNKYTLIDKEKTWLQAMSLRNRKQIPVCKNCHIMLIHKGKYGGQRLSYFTPKIMFDNRIITIESEIHKGKLSEYPILYYKTLEEKGWKPVSKP